MSTKRRPEDPDDAQGLPDPVGRGGPVVQDHVVGRRHHHHEVGRDPVGPGGPRGLPVGKYDTLTRTGVPIFETWKLTVLSVSRTSLTWVLGTGTPGRRGSPIGTRGHDAGPLWARKTFQRDGSSYQLSDGGSHDDWSAPTPTSTAGSLASPVTSGASRTS
jgi:hypothetical protein